MLSLKMHAAIQAKHNIRCVIINVNNQKSELPKKTQLESD